MTSLQQLRVQRQRLMPPSRQIVEEALVELERTHNIADQNYVRANFNQLLRELFVKTLEVLERYEERVDIQLLQQVLGGLSCKAYAPAVSLAARLLFERVAIPQAEGWEGF